jgi:hypothetical protein
LNIGQLKAFTNTDNFGYSKFGYSKLPAGANKKIFLVGSGEFIIGFLNIGKRERDKCFHSVNLIKTESQITVNAVSCIVSERDCLLF